MVQDDPELLARRKARQDGDAAEDAAGLTIAERLTRRAKAQIVSVSLLPDDDGELIIDMHVPSWGQTCELTQMESLMETPKGHKQIAEIMNDLCQTPELDLKFWKSGAIGLSDMRALIEGLTAEYLKSAQNMQEVVSFRAD